MILNKHHQQVNLLDGVEFSLIPTSSIDKPEKPKPEVSAHDMSWGFEPTSSLNDYANDDEYDRDYDEDDYSEAEEDRLEEYIEIENVVYEGNGLATIDNLESLKRRLKLIGRKLDLIFGQRSAEAVKYNVFSMFASGLFSYTSNAPTLDDVNECFDFIVNQDESLNTVTRLKLVASNYVTRYDEVVDEDFLRSDVDDYGVEPPEVFYANRGPRLARLAKRVADNKNLALINRKFAPIRAGVELLKELTYVLNTTMIAVNDVDCEIVVDRDVLHDRLINIDPTVDDAFTAVCDYIFNAVELAVKGVAK